MGMLHGTRRALWGGGGYIYPFSLNDITFTPGMAKRVGEAGVFDAAPIVQGHYDLSGTPDALGNVRGNLLGNALSHFYANFDPYQGTIIQWFTPEISSAALTSGYTYLWYISADYYARYAYNVNRFEYVCGGVTVNRVAAIVAGTTYHITCSWDTLRTLDGTNYIRDGLNDVYAYGGTGLAASAPDTTMYFGRNAILEGTFYIRRVLYDGTYGTPPMDGADELAAIYAAGAGLDPAQVIGSWDTVFCCPTDSTVGALTTGTGEAWSQPHADSLPDVSFMSDGGLPGTPFAYESNGTTSTCVVTDNATIQDLHDAAIQVEFWIRLDEAVAGERVISKEGAGGGEGWFIAISGTTVIMQIYAATVDGYVGTQPIPIDGKFHHVVMHYNDGGARAPRGAIDGVWAAGGTPAQGAVVTDVGNDLLIMDSETYTPIPGGLAWLAVRSAAYYVVGTDFIPDRTPPTLGAANLTECWVADEGTGNTLGAQETSPANDGAIANASWSALWEQDGTPVIPQSLVFDGSATVVDCGSGATLDDIPAGAQMTVGSWVRVDAVSGEHIIVNKTTWGTAGWEIEIAATGYVFMRVELAAADASAWWNTVSIADGVWHYVAAYYDDTAKTVQISVDGIWDTIGAAGAGAYQSDAALNLVIGRRSDGAAFYFPGTVCEVSIWSDDHFSAGTDFVPPARLNPPAAGGNLVESWHFDDGAGTTLTAEVTSPGNDGTITMGTGQWLNTPDMETESPGERVYPWGYAIGSDGADDGITIIETAEVTAGVSYVVRASLSVGMSGRAQPYIEVYDNIGAAQIGADFPYPFMTGVHDGAGGAATLQDSTARWVYGFVGWTLYNITDGSSTTVTANTEITQTGVLAGGGSNDWQVGETYLLRPPSNRSYSQHPWQETFVFTAPAGCTSIDVKVLNAAGEGITHIHQVEVYASLLDTGGMEAGAGVPWVPTGWTATYIAGEGVQELVTIHSGTSAVEIVSAAGTRWLYDWPTMTVGNFYSYGGWLWGNGVNAFALSDAEGDSLQFHNRAAAAVTQERSGGGRWEHVASARRKRDVVAQPGVRIGATGAGSQFIDDIYAFELDDVSLTVTPASYANSLESGGVRVDGLDSATVPATAHRMRARSGGIKFRVRPRHSLANAQALGQSHEYLLDLTEDGNNYLRLYRTTNTLTLAVNQQGAGVATDTDATAWAADTEARIEVLNLGSRIRVRRDGVTVCELAGLAGFATDFTAAAYFGSDDAPDLELDGVIAAP